MTISGDVIENLNTGTRWPTSPMTGAVSISNNRIRKEGNVGSVTQPKIMFIGKGLPFIDLGLDCEGN